MNQTNDSYSHQSDSTRAPKANLRLNRVTLRDLTPRALATGTPGEQQAPCTEDSSCTSFSHCRFITFY